MPLKRIKILPLLLGLALLCSCAHYSYSVSGGNGGRRSGVYCVAQCPSAELKRELLALSSERQTFLDRKREDAVDLSVSIAAPRKIPMGGVKVINNIGSCLTLGIIPWRNDDQAVQSIKVESNCFSKELRAEAGSCLEIGHLPLPLVGIGDILYFVGGTAVGVVVGACTAKYECFLLGFGLLLERNAKKDKQTAQTYLAQNVDNGKLARAIADSLSQKDYQAAMSQLEYRKRFRPASQVADYAEMQRLSSQVRQFAMKHSPELWKRIQNTRAALDVQEEKVNQLRTNLKQLGLQPESDEGFIRICEERYQMALLLKKLHEELKMAYKEAQLYENSFRKNDIEEINRNAGEDGVQDARMLQEHYRQLKKK